MVRLFIIHFIFCCWNIQASGIHLGNFHQLSSSGMSNKGVDLPGCMGTDNPNPRDRGILFRNTGSDIVTLNRENKVLEEECVNNESKDGLEDSIETVPSPKSRSLTLEGEDLVHNLSKSQDLSNFQMVQHEASSPSLLIGINEQGLINQEKVDVPVAVREVVISEERPAVVMKHAATQTDLVGTIVQVKEKERSCC